MAALEKRHLSSLSRVNWMLWHQFNFEKQEHMNVCFTFLFHTSTEYAMSNERLNPIALGSCHALGCVNCNPKTRRETRPYRMFRWWECIIWFLSRRAPMTMGASDVILRRLVDRDESAWRGSLCSLQSRNQIYGCDSSSTSTVSLVTVLAPQILTPVSFSNVRSTVFFKHWISPGENAYVTY